MPADFPASPTLNQTYTFNGRTWKWNATGWELVANSTSTLTLSDGLVVPAATATTPSVRFSGDPNTGLYSPGADQVAISTAGTGRLFITSAGNVGIGSTTNPTALVDVVKGNYSGGPLIGARYNEANLRMGIGIGNLNGFPFLGVNVNNSANSDSGTFDINDWANRLRMGNGNVVFERSTVSGTAGNGITWTESLRITSTGNVGIGTSSPAGALDVAVGGVGPARVIMSQTSDNPHVDLYRTTGVGSNFAGFRLSTPSVSGELAFSNAASNTIGSHSFTERARIDSIGRLLVGTSADITGAAVQTAATTGDASSVSAARFGANANPGYLSVFRSRGATVGTHAALTADDGVGAVYFFGSDGAAYRQAAAITAFVDGGVASADMPGRLVFSVTADGAATATEAMRINNQRELLIGTTTRTANGGVLQISNGITFPGTQSACSDANTLDDYEEGTWTPSYKAVTTDPTVTYENINKGKYIKIGRMVYIQVTVQTTTVSSAGSGNLFIGGLPYTPQTDSSGGYSTFAVGLNTAIAVGAGERVVVLLDGGVARIEIYAQNDDANTFSNLTGSAINSNASARYLFFSGCYLIA